MKVVKVHIKYRFDDGSTNRMNLSAEDARDRSFHDLMKDATEFKKWCRKQHPKLTIVR